MLHCLRVCALGAFLFCGCDAATPVAKSTTRDVKVDAPGVHVDVKHKDNKSDVDVKVGRKDERKE